MGSKLKVVIQKPREDYRYSAGDRVQGTVHLSVLKSLSLKSITVELKCVARSQMMVAPGMNPFGMSNGMSPFGMSNTMNPPGMSNMMSPPGISNMINDIAALGSNGASTQQFLVDSQVLVHQSVEVFPPPEIRQIMQTKSFTLTAGDNEYPFDFLLPDGLALGDQGGISIDGTASMTWSEGTASLHQWVPLPPSMEDQKCLASVSYVVNATAKRSSMFRSDLGSSENFDFVPKNTIQPLPHFSAATSGQVANGRKLMEKLPIHLEVRFPNPPYSVTGEEPCFRLYVVSMQGTALSQVPLIYIQSIVFSMIETIEALVPVDRSTREHQTREVHTVVADREYDNLEFRCTKNQYEEIPLEHYADFIIAETVVPSFAIQNIKRHHRFKFTVGVSVERLSSPPEKKELRKKVQYITMECPNVQVVASGRDITGRIPANKIGAPPYMNNDRPAISEKPQIPAYST